MKAVVWQGPEEMSVEEVPEPELQAGMVVLRPEAVGICGSEVEGYLGKMGNRTPPLVMGHEFAGTVVEVGENVENASEGDRVVTLLDSGGYAEFAVAPAASLIHLPEDLGFVEAAAVPLQGLTAYHTIKTSGALREGETVLVHAAAGGVGTLAVQMAKLLGAGRVVATAGSREKLDLARSLGADAPVDYTEKDWPEKVLEATDGEGADVILEMVGADFPEKNLRCLALFGRMVVFGAASGDRGHLVPGSLMNGCQSVVGFWLVPILSRPDLLAPALEEILGWIASGDLKLTIGATYPLDKAAEAHADLEGRKSTGKLILRP